MTRFTQPVPFLVSRHADVFMSTPGAAGCAGSAMRLIYWADFAIVIVILMAVALLRPHTLHDRLTALLGLEGGC